jgi:hypothetical protein
MTFLQRLWRSELIGFGALIVCATAIAIYGFAASALGPVSSMSPADTARLGFVYTIVFGALPVLLCVAPIYALLAHAGVASWTTVIAVGAAPGLLVLLLSRGEKWLGFYALGCGIVVAVATHVFMKRWFRRSNSAPHSDGREASRVDQSSSAPARGRERWAALEQERHDFP